MEVEIETSILPKDVVMEILKYLSSGELVRVRLVCKIWKDTIDEPKMWKYLSNWKHLIMNRVDQSMWQRLYLCKKRPVLIITCTSSEDYVLDVKKQLQATGVENIIIWNFTIEKIGDNNNMDDILSSCSSVLVFGDSQTSAYLGNTITDLIKKGIGVVIASHFNSAKNLPSGAWKSNPIIFGRDCKIGKIGQQGTLKIHNPDHFILNGVDTKFFLECNIYLDQNAPVYGQLIASANDTPLIAISDVQSCKVVSLNLFPVSNSAKRANPNWWNSKNGSNEGAKLLCNSLLYVSRKLSK